MAVVTSTTEAENAGVDSPAVFECARLKSTVAATDADSVPTAQSVCSVFESFVFLLATSIGDSVRNLP